MNAEFPLWQCHKQVRAAQIQDIEDIPGTDSSLLTFASHQMPIDGDWVRKHVPRIGGYYVVYEDGYASFSPRAAFEAGYSLVNTGATT